MKTSDDTQDHARPAPGLTRRRLMAGSATALAVLHADSGALPAPAQPPARGPWPVERARAWQERVGWLAGANYAPAYAVNQLEMWQPETFDLGAIDREFGWAESLGFNSMRVFTHNLLWEQDPEGFLDRVDRFLRVAERRGLGILFAPFDGVWDPHPRPGAQRPPKYGVHNSGWVQAPGADVLRDPARRAKLKPYVTGLLGRFRNDPRVHGWDLINEPDNANASSYGAQEPPDKPALALELLKSVFAWAREARPSQPLTAGVWYGEWKPGTLNPVQRFCLENSDVLSFHNYEPPDSLRARVGELRAMSPGRPVLCTEYMARGNGSFFDPHLAWMKDNNVAAYNWGFVAGKSQTIFPWDSWKTPYIGEPPVWFHDIFRPDGTPYRPEETRYIRKVTGRMK